MNIYHLSDPPNLHHHAAAVIRQGLTAWLAAAGIESLLTPGPLAELSTIAALSPVRMTLVAAVSFTTLQKAPKAA